MFMDRKGVKKRALLLLLTAGLIFVLSGCRSRTTGNGQGDASGSASSGIAEEGRQGDQPLDAAALDALQSQKEETDQNDGELRNQTKENPEASRKEYDENAPAEIVPGTDRLLHGEGEGSGAALIGEDGQDSVSRLNDQAEESAAQTVAAQEADEMGVSEDAETADSALTYFTVLLQDRMGALFECQRANVYWETAQEHVTIHKSSLEHTLILNAGAYDVSARLLPENLLVDDGWVVRKNPQVIVKIVDRSVLGGSVNAAHAAKAVYQSLLSRDGWAGIDAVRSRQVLLLSQELLEAPYLQAAAMLLIANTANASLFADVDMEEALQMLMEEATGALPTGVYYYSGKEE